MAWQRVKKVTKDTPNAFLKFPVLGCQTVEKRTLIEWNSDKTDVAHFKRVGQRLVSGDTVAKTAAPFKPIRIRHSASKCYSGKKPSA
jgi:hypothetical protein